MPKCALVVQLPGFLIAAIMLLGRRRRPLALFRDFYERKRQYIS